MIRSKRCECAYVEKKKVSVIVALQCQCYVCTHTQSMINSVPCPQVFSVNNAEVEGEGSVEGDSFLLCSFYGEFIDSSSGATVGIPPVQCYKDEPGPISSEFVYTVPASVNILYAVKTEQ